MSSPVFLLVSQLRRFCLLGGHKSTECMSWGEVSVSHGGGDGAVTQELLNGSQVHSPHHPLSRSEVPEIMKTDPLQARLLPPVEERLSGVSPGLPSLQPHKNIRAAENPDQRIEPLQSILREGSVTGLAAFRSFNR